MDYLKIIEDNPDIQRAINEGIIERVLTNREVGIRANSDLNKSQKRFLRMDQNSLIVAIDEMLAPVEQELLEVEQSKREWAEQSVELCIDRLWKDSRFGQ